MLLYLFLQECQASLQQLDIRSHLQVDACTEACGQLVCEVAPLLFPELRIRDVGVEAHIGAVVTQAAVRPFG